MAPTWSTPSRKLGGGTAYTTFDQQPASCAGVYRRKYKETVSTCSELCIISHGSERISNANSRLDDGHNDDDDQHGDSDTDDDSHLHVLPPGVSAAQPCSSGWSRKRGEGRLGVAMRAKDRRLTTSACGRGWRLDGNLERRRRGCLR